jgi:catechol 2,3-dioxygenase-like lactoylglutathione lyase family enzyme
MKLNHLNLTVTDVGAARGFLENYFGLRCAATRGDSFAALADDDGLFLTLMAGKTVEYPGTFHVGFAQESEEKVNEINQRLKDDGFEVKSPARIHGAWTFYFLAPGGFTIEVLGSDDPLFPVGG